MKKTLSAIDLNHTYAHFTNAGAVTPITVNAEFWQTLMSGKQSKFDNGRLMGAGMLETGGTNWEMHPNGDEFLYLVSGRVDIVLEQQDKLQIIELHSELACIVPRGIWHRQIAHEPSKILFITEGAGTQHRSA